MPPKKSLKTRKALSVTDAKAKAKEWITLVEGDESHIAELALEISAFMSGEAAGEEAAAEPPAPEGEMSAIEEAAREVTGLDEAASEAKVVSALYKMELRSAGSTSAKRTLTEEQERSLDEKLKLASDDGRMTPAEVRLAKRRVKEGKLTYADIDEELSVTPTKTKVGPGAPVIEPPDAKDPEATQVRAATTPATPAKPGAEPWRKVVNPDMEAFCEKRSLSLQHYAESWMESNPGKPYVKPTDRNN